MIASRFRPVGWVAAVAVAALGCYLVSLRVAAKRDEVTRIETQIIATRVDMRRLETELGTRSRLVQLERWNSDALGLAAPRVGQYLRSEVQLASLGALPEGAAGATGDGAVLQASYTPPSSAAARPAAEPVATADAAPPVPARHVHLAIDKAPARKPRPSITAVSARKAPKARPHVELAAARQPVATTKHRVQLADKAAGRQHAKASLASAGLPAAKSHARVQLAARNGDAAPLLRRASYTKVGPDRPAGLRQIALLDEDALGTIQRAARAETGGEMGGAKKKRP